MSATTALKHISVSKIEKFLQCPLAFKYRYVDKIPEPSSGVMLAGKVVHEIVEHALRVHAKTGQYPDWKTLDDMYEPTWEKQVKEEEEKDSFLTWQYNPDDLEPKVRSESRELVRIAALEALPKVRPWMIGNDPVVEYRIDLDLECPIGPFKLLGFIDLLDASGILMDWKTAKDKASKFAKSSWLQFAAYSLHVWPLVGDEIVKARKIFLVRGETPHVEYSDYEIKPKHREWFVNIAAQVWMSIHHGIYPARNTGWHCAERFCNFWGPCMGELVKPEPEQEEVANVQA